MSEIFHRLNNTAGRATPGLTRRGFLIGMAAGSAVFGFAGAALQAAKGGKTGQVPGQTPAGFEPTVWYHIDAQGIVTININRAEMGQHVGTALARIVAEELEADWNSVRLRYVDVEPKYAPFVTGGSWSVFNSYYPLSRAGAAGRIALVEAGAKLLSAAPANCVARNGRVIGPAGEISYGEIVARGDLLRTLSAAEVAALPLKPAAQRRLLARETRAIDIPDKTNGKAVFSIDVRVGGMVFGRPLAPPTRNGAAVSAIDDSAAKAVPGYLQTVRIKDPSLVVDGYVVVLAENWMAAMAASEKVKVTWTAGKTAAVTSEKLAEFGRAQIADQAAGTYVINDEGFDHAVSSAARTLERNYSTSLLMHFQMEPLSAIARQTEGGHWELHSGSQWQSLSLPVLSKSLGVPEDRIHMKTYLLGGGFGRRLNDDFVLMAALAAKASGKTVKLMFTREDDCLITSGRTPSVQKLRAAITPDKTIAAFEHHVAAGWATEVIAPALLAKGVGGKLYDPFVVLGAETWYEFGKIRLRSMSNTLVNNTYRTGWQRGVGSGFMNFGIESFVDELAREIGQDPVAFRLAHLRGKGKNAGAPDRSDGGALRQAAVLKRVVELSGYGKRRLPADTALGIATTTGQEREMPTWIACAAQVHVDRKSGVIQCQKLTLVIDCGTVIHPDGALAQAQGGALFGLSIALHEGARFENGQVADRNLDSYTPLRMRDVPEMQIEFARNTYRPMPMGEPPLTVVAPAIANAIFNAVGVRLRELPLRPQAVLAALQSRT